MFRRYGWLNMTMEWVEDIKAPCRSWLPPQMFRRCGWLNMTFGVVAGQLRLGQDDSAKILRHALYPLGVKRFGDRAVLFEAGAADGAIGYGQKFPCVGLGDAASHQDEPLGDRRARLGHITKADLSMANLSGANLSGVDLGRSDLGLANLVKANLTGADLTGATLFDAAMSGANLRDANLTGATLREAFLAEADLTRARLEFANRRANLTNAILDGVIGADFTGALNVPAKYLKD